MYPFFVILSQQRSGTRLLGSLLGSHPRIDCGGEVVSARDDAGKLAAWYTRKSQQDKKARSKLTGRIICGMRLVQR